MLGHEGYWIVDRYLLIRIIHCEPPDRTKSEVLDDYEKVVASHY